MNVQKFSLAIHDKADGTPPLKRFRDADVLAFEQELRNIFGTRDVSLKGDINKGSIIIGFDNKKDFDRIYEVLMSKK